jgi:hypothetical protein
MVFRQNTDMSPLRRFISLCLMLAFASYGSVVAASAHAHDEHDGRGYALHAVAVDVDHAHVDHDHHHDHDGLADDHSTGGTGDVGGVTHGGFHVHGVAAFTAVDEPLAISQPVTASVMVWDQRSAVVVSGHFSPLKKPPRFHL